MGWRRAVFDLWCQRGREGRDASSTADGRTALYPQTRLAADAAAAASPGASGASASGVAEAAGDAAAGPGSAALEGLGPLPGGVAVLAERLGGSSRRPLHVIVSGLPPAVRPPQRPPPPQRAAAALHSIAQCPRALPCMRLLASKDWPRLHPRPSLIHAARQAPAAAKPVPLLLRPFALLARLLGWGLLLLVLATAYVAGSQVRGSRRP
jgi:hypothetical protein